MNPLIGITIYSDTCEKGTMPDHAWINIANPYVKCIKQLGGTPIVIPIVKHYNMSTDIIEKLDGAIFASDNRMDPCDNFRSNELEIEFSKRILQSDLPVLGIGRGLKLINYIRGGTLDNADVCKSRRIISYLKRTRINIASDTKLREIAGRDAIEAYAGYVQSIKQLGRDLQINALREDGVIVGIESVGDRFLVALECNPELVMQLESVDDTYSKDIFKYFITKSLKYKTSKSSHN